MEEVGGREGPGPGQEAASRSAPATSAGCGQEAQGPAIGDLDLDGVSDPLDIDDDGDLVLDYFDSSPSGSGAGASGGIKTLLGGFGLGPWLALGGAGLERKRGHEQGADRGAVPENGDFWLTTPLRVYPNLEKLRASARGVLRA